MKNACSWTERNFRLFVIASDNILSVPYSLKYVESLLLGTVKRANQHFDIKNPPEKFLQQTPNLEPSLFKTKYTHFKKPFHVAPFISSSVIQNHSRRHRSRKWGPANQPDVFSARLSRPCSTPQGLFGQAPFRVTWLPRFFFPKTTTANILSMAFQSQQRCIHSGAKPAFSPWCWVYLFEWLMVEMNHTILDRPAPSSSPLGGQNPSTKSSFLKVTHHALIHVVFAFLLDVELRASLTGGKILGTRKSFDSGRSI